MNLEQAKALDKKAWHKHAAKLKPETRNFIDGKFVAAAGGKPFESINPANGDVVAELPRSSAADVDKAVAAARKAFRSGVWSRMAPRARMDVLYKYAQLLQEHALEFAVLDVL